MNKLEKICQTHIELFFKRIQVKYNVDFNDIKREWIVFNSDPVFFCVYTFTRLPKKGETCGKKIKSGEYCSAHAQKSEKNNEKKEIKEKSKDLNATDLKTTEKLEVVRMNYKIGKYIHPPTKLAFFSKEHKVVYGKLSLQDTIIPLCDKDINLCKQYMFRYDLALFKQCL